MQVLNMMQYQGILSFSMMLVQEAGAILEAARSTASGGKTRMAYLIENAIDPGEAAIMDIHRVAPASPECVRTRRHALTSFRKVPACSRE